MMTLEDKNTPLKQVFQGFRGRLEPVCEYLGLWDIHILATFFKNTIF
jgi:hypothetical protein